MDHILAFRSQGKSVRYLRCDNAGEHRNLIHYCNHHNADENNDKNNKRLESALRKLNTSLESFYMNSARPNSNQRLRPSLRVRNVDRQHNRSVNFVDESKRFEEVVFNTATISDPYTPVTIQMTRNGVDKDTWTTSIKSEVNNFLKIESWKYVSRDEALKQGRNTLIPCKWLFKI